MLNPNNDRLDYGQVLAPPDKYRLDFAIGTTYSLDLDALVGACIALGLSEETDSDLMKNPICLLEALRTTGDKVALFCEGGQIHTPNSVTPLYILLDRYDKVPNNNARLDRVMAHTFKDNAELLLWVPPARPYYQPQGVFKNVSDFSKTLVFSSWEMVPRMIAGLLSYEAERKTVGKLAKANEDKEAHYFYTGEKRYRAKRQLH